jgi:hypothetical protein
MESDEEPLSSEVESDLVGELARAVLQQAAPEELVLFDEVAADYYRDPALLRRRGRGDEAVGFGLELALLTPYVLAVGTAVIQFLASVVADAVRDELKPVVAGPIRRLIRPGAPVDQRPGEENAAASPGLNEAQAREVRRLALRRAKEVGLDDGRAALLADALVGALYVAG